jgi:hypothetical protein
MSKERTDLNQIGEAAMTYRLGRRQLLKRAAAFFAKEIETR